MNRRETNIHCLLNQLISNLHYHNSNIHEGKKPVEEIVKEMSSLMNKAIERINKSERPEGK